MRDLVFHVGPQKTGSTFLQSLIARNRPMLEAAGLGLAPHLDPDPKAGCHVRYYIAALRAEGAEAVMAATAAVPGDRLLVTDEDLARFLLQPAEGRDAVGQDAPGTWADVLVAAARRHGFRPRLLYFARRQDHLVDSHLFQAAKTWYRGRLADLPQDALELDHNLRLGRFEAVFGPENVTVALYHDDRRNDIAADFFGALGLAAVVPGLDRGAAAANSSMGRRKTMLLTFVPKNRRKKPSLLNPPGLADRVVRAVGRSSAIADDGIRSLISPAGRRALVTPYLEGNRALVARHGIADPGDFVALPEADAGWHPPAPIRTAEVAAVFRAAAAEAWSERAIGALPRLAWLFAQVQAAAQRDRGAAAGTLAGR